MSNHPLRVLLGALLLPLADASAAGNRLDNPDFDTNLAGWTSDGTCSPPAWDSFGPGFTNGAMAVNCFAASTHESSTQCVRIPTTDVDFSAEVSDNGQPGPVMFELLSYASTDCSGTPDTVLDPATTATVPAADCCGVEWTLFSRKNLTLATGTRSVRVGLIVVSPADIALDDIVLAPSVFQDNFDGIE